MIPPTKPPRRPGPDPRGLPIARHEEVPGVPRQSLSPRALEAAREAARPSVHDVQIEALGDRVDGMERAVGRFEVKLDGLSAKVSEWELTAAGSENVKLQEEGKTKRLSVIVGLLTIALNAVVTIGVNVVSRPMEHPQLTPMSQNDLDMAECRKKIDLTAQAKCANDIVLRNITPSQH